MDFKKILAIVLAIIACIGFYLVGKALDIDIIGQFAPYIATAVIGWVIWLVNKLFGVKLDFLNNELVKQKVIESLVWAEGQAIEKFKLNDIISKGTEKTKWATAQIMSALPNVTNEKATELIQYYFPQIRTSLEKMWVDLANEIKTKAELKSGL